MHDSLEGVCNYDLTEILTSFILNFKYFSLELLELLNQRLIDFDYGPHDVQNKPQPIAPDFLKKN